MIKLRPHQEKILNELHGEKAIGLFMGTGTGKTITSLFKHKELGSKKLCVISPPTVTKQWEKEIRAVLGEDFRVLSFPKSYTSKKMLEKINKTSPCDYDAIIVKWGVLTALKEKIKQLVNCDFTLIADESHRFKSSLSKISETMDEIKHLTDKKIILTATPTEGKEGGYIDYFTQLNFLGILGPYNDERKFKKQFCITRKANFPNVPFPVSVIKGYKNIDQLTNIIKSCCRYYEGKRGDYDPVHVKVPFDKPRNYEKLFKGTHFGSIKIDDPTRLRVAMKTMTSGFVYGRDDSKNKKWEKDNFDKLIYLKEFLQDVNGRVLVFYQYHIERALLEKLLKKEEKKYKVIDGKTKDKYEVVNSGDYEVLIGQFQAVSESLDGLQHLLNIAIFFTMPESSITYRQAIGRIDRDGQKKVPTYYYFISSGTVDEFIFQSVLEKRNFSVNDLENYAIKEKQKRQKNTIAFS